MKGDLIPILSSLIEKYNSDEDIASVISDLLLRLAKGSKKIALQMGQKSYIRSAVWRIKESTCNIYKQDSDEHMTIPIRDLQYLLLIASVDENIKLIHEEDVLSSVQRILELQVYTCRLNRFHPEKKKNTRCQY